MALVEQIYTGGQKAREIAENAHRALNDAANREFLLRRIAAQAVSLAELLEADAQQRGLQVPR